MKIDSRAIDRSTVHDSSIDAALRFYGGAVPEAGLESRVAARLAAMPRRSFRPGWLVVSGRPWLAWVRGASVAALAAAAACAVVVGTVRHSQQPVIPQALRGSQFHGASTAAGEHIPTRAVAPSATMNPQAPRPAARTRSTVARNQQNKAAAVPRSPYGPGQQTSSPRQ